MRPLLLDLFCCAGGAAKGYDEAGFEVIGVDIEPQPNYPFEFIQADAMTFRLDGFDAIHASPPCQDYSATRSLHNSEYPRLIQPIRERLQRAGVPYVIENVERAKRELINPVRLCGSSFGLSVWRHRMFEMSWANLMPWMVPPCAHYLVREPIDVTGTGGPRRGKRLDGKGGNSRKPDNLEHAGQVMGIDWMTRKELSEAVPPAMTRWIGRQLLRVVTGEAVA